MRKVITNSCFVVNTDGYDSNEYVFEVNDLVKDETIFILVKSDSKIFRALRVMYEIGRSEVEISFSINEKYRYSDVIGGIGEIAPNRELIYNRCKLLSNKKQKEKYPEYFI